MRGTLPTPKIDPEKEAASEAQVGTYARVSGRDTSDAARGLGRPRCIRIAVYAAVLPMRLREKRAGVDS